MNAFVHSFRVCSPRTESPLGARLGICQNIQRFNRSFMRYDTRATLNHSAKESQTGLLKKPWHSSPAPDSTARTATITRTTKETQVNVYLNLDGTGHCEVDTGVPFLDHMLAQLAAHGLFDIAVLARGDTWIDDHHTNEDVGISLGMAIAEAVGNKRGIRRFGNFAAPLDEALVDVVLDLSGRAFLGYNLELKTEKVGKYDTQLVKEFYAAVAGNAHMTLHINQRAGENSHHIIEASFKAFARAFRFATEIDPRRRDSVPSSKGVL